MKILNNNLHSNKAIQYSFGLLLAFYGLPVFAVSLGQVQMLSGLGQPLLAEIPIYDTDDTDLESLTIQLASDSAYSRLGLNSKSVEKIQLAIVSNDSGNLFVQMKTDRPFNEPVLTVLLEAKWGDDGHLVKELNALVDPPYVSKTAVQTIEAPTVILRPEVAPQSLPPETVRTPTIGTGSSAFKASNDPKKVMDSGNAVAKKPIAVKQAPEQNQAVARVNQTPVAARTPLQPVQIPASATNQLTVEKGDNLSKIAGRHQQQIGAKRISLNQMMMAIQRANTNAFINGNPNLLKSGSVLRLPDEPQVLAMLPEDTANLLQSQWSKKVTAQPAPALDTANKLGNKQAGARASSDDQSVLSVLNQGRLKIVPTVGIMNNSGSQTGASKSGQGQELRVDNTLSQEEIATRQAEIGTLKTQLNDAVKLQMESKKLIELQNSQIKLLTQRMQELEKGTTATSNQSSVSPTLNGREGEANAPWYLSPISLILGLLLVAAALGFMLKRKK